MNTSMCLQNGSTKKSISSEKTPNAILFQIVIQAFPPGATMPPATPV
jgi:hypothetical protein